jgi:hypothetical protein
LVWVLVWVGDAKMASLGISNTPYRHSREGGKDDQEQQQERQRQRQQQQHSRCRCSCSDNSNSNRDRATTEALATWKHREQTPQINLQPRST